MSNPGYDVIIIGGGHAGCEAAAASARLGATTLLVTKFLSDIGVMSCNPAIGGLGKGQIVREIDALDGLMGRIADISGLQFRVLNQSRGAATQGLRAQIDRRLYAANMQNALLNYRNLTIKSAIVDETLLVGEKIKGVRLDTGEEIFCAALVITTGTFLRGEIHIGAERIPAGRLNEPSAINLGICLEKIGLPLGRLKTGTPPRLDGRTIHWDKLEPQPGDAIPTPFSYLTEKISIKQLDCYITRTNPQTHKIIRENINSSAVFSGAISGRGPRYCPSIEDKVTRFSDRDSHQIFLEPEGFDDFTIYPNGISTSLDLDTQKKLVQSINGLENAEILKPGYAIEYDYFNPTGLTPDLQSKFIEGMFLAGQINGTTGYEEAAGQGIVAGINAARFSMKQDLLTIKRSSAFIGVMIDDLVSRGISEPYRMFTSRSEFRLNLRSDNADLRLTPLGMELGCIEHRRREVFAAKKVELTKLIETLKAYFATPFQAAAVGIHLNADGIRRSGFEILARTDVTFKDLIKLWPELEAFSHAAQKQAEIEAKYAVYLDRQKIDIESYNKYFEVALPSNIDFNKINGLSNELRLKLRQYRPKTLAHAYQMEGMTPSAMTLLAAYAHPRGEHAENQ